MNFSAWAIKQPIPSILLFVVLSLAGIAGFRALPIQNQPDLDLPTVIINASLPGATPASLETEVTRKIEDSVAALSGVSHITSTVNDGSSVTRIEFVLEKDVQEAVNDVRNAVDSIRSNLPADLRPPVVVIEILVSQDLSAQIRDTLSRARGHRRKSYQPRRLACR